MPSAWFNGDIVDEDDPQVTLLDTGLLHAAGVFTTMRAKGGRVYRLEKHLQRLRTSCDALFVPLKFSDADLAGAVDEVLDRNELADARLRLTVTRGQSTQDPLHGTHLSPNCFITATQLQPYPEHYYAQGLTVMLNDEQKLNPYDIQAGHKTLNYFSRLAALREAVRRGAGEALWFNVHNYLQSASVANVFIVKDGAMVTPPTAEELRDPEIAENCPYPKSNVLPGITRAAVLELAREHNLPVHIQAVNVNHLLEAREVFLTNSIMQVMPVGRIEQHKVGDETPGPITRALMELYEGALT
ncbi:MAG TPA: aminotransferase class IV [Tepidisphaeraceae bacterium]|jgi:branched-subunit amino acid aminotransferase/4-amino-4-deoxychorismate lyase